MAKITFRPDPEPPINRSVSKGMMGVCSHCGCGVETEGNEVNLEPSLDLRTRLYSAAIQRPNCRGKVYVDTEGAPG